MKGDGEDRREAGKPNEIWQADHTLLDLWAVTPSGESARPWLTLIEDDHSSPVGQDAALEPGAGPDERDQVGCVHGAPTGLGGLDELEYHAQRCGPAARTLGDRGA
jgi:hypothetical protein